MRHVREEAEVAQDPGVLGQQGSKPGGAGRDLKVTVAFDDAEIGVKNLLVAYAGLEREWESA